MFSSVCDKGTLTSEWQYEYWELIVQSVSFYKYSGSLDYINFFFFTKDERSTWLKSYINNLQEEYKWPSDLYE